MTDVLDGQVSMYDLGMLSTKTSPEHSAQTKVKTSKPSSRRSRGSQTLPPLLCLSLKTEDGLMPGASTERWATGVLPIGLQTLNTGELRKGENGLLWLPTSQDSPLSKLCLTLNCGEYPRFPNPTKLSQILEPDVDPKYNLSPKACQGILKRAEKRGRALPPALESALRKQAGFTRSVSKNAPVNLGGGKGILIQDEHTGALSTLNIQHIFQPVTYDARGNGDGSTVNTITGDHNDRVTDYTALVLSFKQGNGPKARGIGLAENVSPSLVSSESGTNMVPVVLPFDTTQITSPNNYSNPKAGDPCHPLAASAHPPAVAIGNGQLHNISMDEIGNTLDTMHDAQAILVPDTAHALHAKANCQYREDSETYLVDNPGTVRRLTPTECARLQGFPDDWVEVGEWMDDLGKKHSDANTHKYKAYGNSIAVGYANNGSGFWMWLLKRISAHYERNATLGSLFDGIGGFPLAWEHFNGKGSALWASEIEPFPIAVTKHHFEENGD